MYTIAFVIFLLLVVNYMCDTLLTRPAAECLADSIDKGQLHENPVCNYFSKAKGN